MKGHFLSCMMRPFPTSNKVLTTTTTETTEMRQYKDRQWRRFERYYIWLCCIFLNIGQAVSSLKDGLCVIKCRRRSQRYALLGKLIISESASSCYKTPEVIIHLSNIDRYGGGQTFQNGDPNDIQHRFSRVLALKL